MTVSLSNILERAGYSYEEVRKYVHDLRGIVSKIDGYLELRRTTHSRGKKSYYQKKVQEKVDELTLYLDQIPK